MEIFNLRRDCTAKDEARTATLTKIRQLPLYWPRAGLWL